MKLDLQTGLIILAIVVVTLKFRTPIMSALSKVPVVGSLVA